MNILAFGAHPDDIELGCGGTLLKMKDNGHNIFMFVMTHGDNGGSAEVRVKEQENAAEQMGVSEVFWGGQKDTRIVVDSNTISTMYAAIKECKADLVFFNHPNDTHQDHRAMAKCVITASRFMKSVLAFELPTSLDFNPNVFVNIADYMDRKEEILKLHCSQMRKNNGAIFCLDEYVRPFAVFRGLQARSKFVEGFAAHRMTLDNF